MKKIFLLLIILTSSVLAFSQNIEDKLNIYIGYQMGSFQGPTMVTQGNFISPALYANYGSLKGLTLKAVVKQSKFFSFGLQVATARASDWALPGYDNYNGSSISLTSISPVIQFHTPFRKTGFSNKIKVYLEIAPTFGISNLKLASSLFDINAAAKPMSSSDLFFGVKAGAGIELTLSSHIGFYLSYAYQRNQISGTLFTDDHFASTQLDVGLFIRLQRNHHSIY